MPKEYQSEKSPIFDSQKSLKTQRKLHIMSQLYASKVCQTFCNTRYIFIYHLDTDALTLAEFIQDSHRASRNSINFYIVKTIFLDSVDT